MSSKRKKLLLLLGGGVIVSITMWLIVANIIAPNKAFKEAEIRATLAGIPLTVKAMRERYVKYPVASKIATQKFKKAIMSIVMPDSEERKELPLYSIKDEPQYFMQFQAPMVKIIPDFIDKNSRFFQLINAVDDFNQVRFTQNYNTPDYHRLYQETRRELVTLYCIKTEAEIIKKNKQQAFISMQQGLHLLNTLLNEPFFILNLKYANFSNIWIHKSLHRLVHGFKLSDEELKKIIADLSQCETNIKQSFTDALDGEVFYFNQSVDKKDPILWHDKEYNRYLKSKELKPIKKAFSTIEKISDKIEKAAMINDVLEIKKHLLNFNDYHLIKHKW